MEKSILTNIPKGEYTLHYAMPHNFRFKSGKFEEHAFS